jgi:predicted nucleic acid-binding protein
MILVDTTPLVALCDARDSHHAVAIRELEKLASAGLCTCEAVLMESCFHLPHRHQRQRLHALLDALGISSLPAQSDRSFWSGVFNWLHKYAEHEPDWTDGCIAVLCGQNRRLKVWSYDQEFRTTWRRPDGTAIPLAVRG